MGFHVSGKIKLCKANFPTQSIWADELDLFLVALEMSPVVLAEADAFMACGADVTFAQMIFLVVQFEVFLAFKHLFT